MRQLSCMVIILVTVAYISIGGVVFHLLESDNETDVRTRADGFLRDFLENNTCISREEMVELLQASFEAYQSGSLQAMNQTEAQTNWDYYSSIFFAMTVVTTIGYGHISPSTVPGRIFCAVFAIIGIPLFLINATAIGQRLYWIIRKSQKRCFRSEEDGTRTKGAKICGGIAYAICGICLLILVPAALFMLMEDWNYLEGTYYSFITLTTIGFGDYVAGNSEGNGYFGFRGIYRLAVAGWIFIGLSWMAGIITFMQEMYSKPGSDHDPDSMSKSGSVPHSSSNSDNHKERVWSRADSGYGDPIQNVHNRHNSVMSYDSSLYKYNGTHPPIGTPPPKYEQATDIEAILNSEGYLTKL